MTATCWTSVAVHMFSRYPGTPRAASRCTYQDRARAVASFKRLAALDVATACFGHGDPIDTGAGDRIRDAAVTLTP
jgi:hypothetical protein